jgi:hypothetical protein
MDRATRRAVVIRVVVVAATLLAMAVISLTRGTNAEAAIDLDRAQHASVAAVMAGIDYRVVQPVGYSDVVDPATGSSYLAQTARLFLIDPSLRVSGSFEYAVTSPDAVVAFHESLGVSPGDWVEGATDEIVVMVWHAEQGAFGGAGDTLVVLLDPESGLETRAIIAYAQTDELRSDASTVTTSDLAIGGLAAR